jgi:hypothetical protein
MGGSAIKGFPLLFRKLKKESVDINLLYLVDPKKEANWNRLLDWCEKRIGYSPGIYRKIKDALHSARFFQDINIDAFPIIIYDASTAQFHYPNLSEIISQNRNNNLFYLGEKPLVFDAEQIKDLDNLPKDYSFFCELIETENPVFKKTKQYIADNKLKIKRLSFWRAGSNGIKQAISAGRQGVTGGALIDKSAHDFSISIGLLEPEEIKGFCEGKKGSQVTQADIHYFIIAKEYFEKRQRVFLDASNNSSEQIEIDYWKDRSKLSADGLFSTSLIWRRRGKLGNVEADYLFSWLGYTGYPDESKAHPEEKKFVDRLNQLGFKQNEWLVIAKDKKPKSSSDPLEDKYNASNKRYKCRIEEIRIGIIECDKKTIVCNFLTKYKQLYRYAYAINTRGEREPIYEEKRGQASGILKIKDLMSVIYAVSKDCLKRGSSKYIARKATLLVHQAMFKAQSIALDKLKPSPNSLDCFNKVLPIFNAHIED